MHQRSTVESKDLAGVYASCISHLISQMVPESFPKEFGGTEFTEAEALLVWKAQCTPYMTNKYRT